MLCHGYKRSDSLEQDPIRKTTDMYRDHPSIKVTHYSPLLLFYTPWKHWKTFRFSDVFRWYRKATPGCNGLIKNKNNSQIVRFNQIKIEEVKKLHQNLDLKKASQKVDIKTNVLRKNVELFAKYAWDNINHSISFPKFTNELKQAHISTHKKSYFPSHYRPISIIPNISNMWKVFIPSNSNIFQKYIFQISMWFPQAL